MEQQLAEVGDGGVADGAKSQQPMSGIAIEENSELPLEKSAKSQGSRGTKDTNVSNIILI